jgi:hypothetical protein
MQFFSVFQIILIVFSLQIIHRNRIKIQRASKKEFFLFIISIIYVLSLILNPNNSPSTPILGLALGSDVSSYTYLLFMLSIFFGLSSIDFILIIRTLFSYFVILMPIRLVILLLLYIAGLGNSSLEIGVSSLIMEEDTLLFIIFLQLFCLVYYFIKRENKYLFASIIIMFLIILSIRRAPTFITILGSIAITTIYFIKSQKFTNLFVFILPFVFIIVFARPIISSMPSSVKFFYYRNLAAFVDLGMGEKSKDDWIVHNEHFEQSEFAVRMAFAKLDFFGVGYGNEINQFTYKSSRGIHNSYVEVVMKYGVIPLICTLFMLVLILNELRKLIRDFYKYGTNYIIFKFLIIVFLILYFSNLYVYGLSVLINIKMRLMQILLFAILFKITPNNFSILLDLKLKKSSGK